MMALSLLRDGMQKMESTRYCLWWRPVVCDSEEQYDKKRCTARRKASGSAAEPDHFSGKRALPVAESL